MSWLLSIATALKLYLAIQVGTATTFWSNGDLFNPNPLNYCTNKILDDRSLVAAHPSLPCHSEAIVINPRTLKIVKVKILDRGPRRALIDLSRGASQAIDLNGKETVILIPLK